VKSRVCEVQIKSGMPTAAEARRRLDSEIAGAKQRGVRVLKLIHGYGSTGVGGKLRGALRRALAVSPVDGKVKRVVSGERFSIFDETTRALLEDYPELRLDRDLERGNAGVTFVELK
jgi:hypothetical protein